MDLNLLVQTLNSSPSVRLIKMRNAEFFLAFVTNVFEEERAVGQEKLFMLLENRLDNQNLQEEEMANLTESNDVKSKRLIKEWTDKGVLTN